MGPEFCRFRLAASASPLPLRLCLRVRLVEANSFLRTKESINTIRVVNTTRLYCGRRVVTSLQAHRRNVTSTLAGMATGARLVRRTQLVNVSTANRVLNVGVTRATLRPRPPPVVSSIFVRRVATTKDVLNTTAKGVPNATTNVPFPMIHVVRAHLKAPIFRIGTNVRARAPDDISHLFLVTSPNSRYPKAKEGVRSVRRVVPTLDALSNVVLEPNGVNGITVNNGNPTAT